MSSFHFSFADHEQKAQESESESEESSAAGKAGRKKVDSDLLDFQILSSTS